MEGELGLVRLSLRETRYLNFTGKTGCIVFFTRSEHEISVVISIHISFGTFSSRRQSAIRYS